MNKHDFVGIKNKVCLPSLIFLKNVEHFGGIDFIHILNEK